MLNWHAHSTLFEDPPDLLKINKYFAFGSEIFSTNAIRISIWYFVKGQDSGCYLKEKILFFTSYLLDYDKSCYTRDVLKDIPNKYLSIYLPILNK